MPARKKARSKALEIEPQTLRVHRVEVNLKNFILPKRGSAIEVEIFDDTGKIGSLQVGRGSLGWKAGKMIHYRVIRWPDFMSLMAERFGDK
jgi:hypothetical protein